MKSTWKTLCTVILVGALVGTLAGDPVVRRFDPGEKFPDWSDRGWANLKKMLAKYPMELRRPEAKTLCVRVAEEPAGLLSSGPWASVEAAPENAVANPYRGARAIRAAVVHKERGYRANIRAWVCPSSFAAMRKAIQASALFRNATRLNTWHSGVKPIPVTSASYVANFGRGSRNHVVWSVGNMAVVLITSKDTDKSFASQAELARLASRLSLVASGPARKAKPAKPTQLKVTVKETGKGSAAISVETPKDGGLKGWWLRLDTSAGRLKLEAPGRATLQDVPKGGATVNCFAISPDGKTWLCRDIKVQGKQSSDTKPSQDGFEPVKSSEPQQDAGQLDWAEVDP